MRKLEIVQLVRREVRALLKLSPWLLLSFLLAAVLWSVDLTMTAGLFQSPPELTPPAEAGTPVITPTLALTPVVTPTLALTPTLAPSPTVDLILTAEPVVSPTVTAVPSAPPPTDETGSSEAAGDESERYADEEASLAFEWGMLFDSVALMASYAWLCCGALAFLAIPVFFVVLWVTARRRQQGEEE
jgi:hypothetical protein